MNSYLRTPKLKKFQDLIDILNHKKGLTINKYSYSTADLSEDGWLAGFTDADGSFGIINTKKESDIFGKITKKRRVACRFRIQQRMIDPVTNESYEDLFNKIALFLGVNLLVVTRNTGKQSFSLEAKSRESLSVVKNYFNTYPLFSSKYLDFKAWDKVVNLILLQTHYDNENLDLIEELKGEMNNNRSNINWGHLDRLGKIKKQGLLEKNLKACLIHTTSTCVYKNNNLGQYLAGLFEGDGHIWIQGQSSKKTHNPRFCITFSMKNESLAQKLLGIIGSGFIRYKPKDNACVLVVSPVVGLKKIVNLVNGELKTPKIYQLHNLIDWLNKNHRSGFEKLPLNKDSIQNSRWLSGFVDADGSFSVQHIKTETGAAKRKIACRLRIEQRILDPETSESYFDILNQICLFLNCNLLTRTQKSTGNTYYTLAASSKVSLNIITQYFDKHPLFSSKFLDYKDWELVAKLIINNLHFTDEGINTVEHVRNRMNTKRVYFNWDHLNGLG
uniref:LAGLIDADG endonuclease n=1 Tax=Juglanconis sp. TaxID=2041886 RepID=A0A291LJ26_9PEZI|nr:LAGLIDADG endonuclease [Juglanconis sp.]